MPRQSLREADTIQEADPNSAHEGMEVTPGDTEEDIREASGVEAVEAGEVPMAGVAGVADTRRPQQDPEFISHIYSSTDVRPGQAKQAVYNTGTNSETYENSASNRNQNLNMMGTGMQS